MDGIDRIYAPESELQLDSAWRALRERHILVGHEYAVNGAAFSPDGELVVTVSTDKTIRLWETSTGRPIGELFGHQKGVRALQFIGAGAHLVSASDDGTLRLWDTASGTEHYRFNGHAAAVTFIQHAPEFFPECGELADTTVHRIQMSSRDFVGVLTRPVRFSAEQQQFADVFDVESEVAAVPDEI